MKKLILLTTLAVLMAGCGMHKKIGALKTSPVSAGLSLPEEQFIPLQAENPVPETDTVRTDIPEESLIMNAVKDENGEMTATDVIRAAKVTARFRNVAERHGKVDLQFQITVPEALQDGKWQLQLNPDMFIMGDSSRLEPVIITGAQYRKRQLRGYEQYRRFLGSIITDSDKFLNTGQLEIFLKRNIPQIYKYRTDSTLVSDEEFSSVYGVTEQAAVEHYTNRMRVRHNERKESRKDKMFRKYVKAPMAKDGIRLDTVILSPDGDFIYNYTQTISTCPGLRKAEIVLSGEILENGEKVLGIPPSQPLTFYISSISSLADHTERYKTAVISRQVEANTICYVDFSSGSTDIDPELGNNRPEIERIRQNLTNLLCNREFDLDSITVTASCSPEGLSSYNVSLSRRRASAISGYFGRFIKHCRDSLKAEAGFLIDAERHSSSAMSAYHVPDVKFLSRSAGENWTMLDKLVEKDTVLGRHEIEDYMTIRKTEDEDEREEMLAGRSYYRYLREKLYPRLRTVKFDFFLHRKGMVQDTVQTTVLDTAYMSGIEAITDRDYKKAVSILRPYHDYNLAVAYCSLDYNASALDILEKLHKTDKVCYLLAILYSRTGNLLKAAECYETACSMNPAFVHRGNLDPEISSLIKKFHLDRDSE